MPIYVYLCERCNKVHETFQHITDDSIIACPICGEQDPLINHKVPQLPHTDMIEFARPIEMLSIALNTDDEILEFKQKCPDIDISLDPTSINYGIPIARTRKQKLQALDAVGFVEKS